MNMPDAMAASPQAGMEDPAALAYFSAKQREQWRRRTLPVLGLLGLIVLWWAAVTGSSSRVTAVIDGQGPAHLPVGE